MKPVRLALRAALVAIVGASMTACAGSSPRQAGLDYRSEPPPTMQSASSPSNASGQRLTIKSGEGERLDVPWFVRDTQDAINSNSN